MQLKSLEITGFKSFPDKTLITFSSGITAIVGPNGSGKSNIADAIRWVMGETSTKNLRGVKMEDVVFDGTVDRKPLGYADVCLTLNNSDGTLPLEYSEVEIARRYYRSGESEYFINRQQVRLRDIHDLFRDTGLGKTGYSIIGQGSVTEIISSKSSDRRYLFEEAAGIAKFKFKKEESEKKLALTQDNILRLNDIVSELGDRLGPLEQQAKKARRYIELYDEKKQLDISIWLDDIDKCIRDLAKTTANAEALQHSINEADNGILQCENDMETLNSDIQRLTAEIEALRAESREFDEKLQEINSSILLLKNDSEHVKKDISRINDEIAESEKTGYDIDRETEDHKNKIAETEKIISLSQTETDEIIAEKNEKLSRDSEYAINSERLSSETAELNERITALQIVQAKAAQLIATLDEQNKTTKQELTDAEERRATLKASKENNERLINENKDTEDGQKNILGGYSLKIKNKRDLQEKLNKEFNDTKLSLSDKINRKTMLEDMEKHYEGFAGSVKSVMNASQQGVLKGVCGTVASLINVEDSNTIALETALGAALQNIVTEKERDAKDCIYYLKSRNLGRATFLPVETVSGKKLDGSGLKNQPGYIGLACELVKTDPVYDGIINQLLGRTAVVDDIDNATALAAKNRYSFRIVTLDGQTVNPGGSLTGGSTGKNTGILSRANEIERLNAVIETETGLLREKSEALKACTLEVNALQSSIDGLLEENKVIDEEKIRLYAEKEHIASYISNVDEQIKSCRTLLSGMDGRLSAAEKEKAEAEKSLNEARAALEEKKQQLRTVAAQHEELNAIQDEINARLHKKELERLELKSNADALYALIKTLDEKKASGQGIIEVRNSQIKENEKLLLDYDERINAFISETEKLKNCFSEKSALIDRKNAERTEAEAGKNRLHDEEMKLFEKKDGLGREAERLEIKQTALKNEREATITKIWDEYELTLSEAKEKAVVPEDMEAAKKRASELKNSIKALGSVNVESIEEFAQVKQRYDTLQTQITDLSGAKEALERIISGLVEEMTAVFNEKFKLINEAFSKTFRELFNGGTAKLTLTEPESMLTSGVDIYVAPPGKVIKHLSSLSGGEQSLTAIALYFALMKVRPSPFCLLDEIESALDDINVVRYANYVRNLSSNTQFLCITHRRGTMEAADRLYGVTMREKGISKILAINITETEKGYTDNGLA